MLDDSRHPDKLYGHGTLLLSFSADLQLQQQRLKGKEVHTLEKELSSHWKEAIGVPTAAFPYL